jgi:hypothetical protein
MVARVVAAHFALTCAVLWRSDNLTPRVLLRQLVCTRSSTSDCTWDGLHVSILKGSHGVYIFSAALHLSGHRQMPGAPHLLKLLQVIYYVTSWSRCSALMSLRISAPAMTHAENDDACTIRHYACYVGEVLRRQMEQVLMP